MRDVDGNLVYSDPLTWEDDLRIDSTNLSVHELCQQVVTTIQAQYQASSTSTRTPLYLTATWLQ